MQFTEENIFIIFFILNSTQLECEHIIQMDTDQCPVIIEKYKPVKTTIMF